MTIINQWVPSFSPDKINEFKLGLHFDSESVLFECYLVCICLYTSGMDEGERREEEEKHLHNAILEFSIQAIRVHKII